MAFLLPPDEIVYYHYIKARAHDVLLIKERPTITFGVTADSAVTPTVIVVIPYSANISRTN